MSLRKKVDLWMLGAGRGKRSVAARFGNRIWWHIPVSPTLQRLRREFYNFEGSLGYIASSGPLLAT